ncbi:DUF2345 domain-containing protein [Paraburkholderia flagellata]|uniref:DUF2345 domain-containing protein n=1 Tax=Paraburkholderia flagellata TaxID=2883241 RepID=UPI001F19A879|nr:DUF2345 domain-containing protein [Paraburkholderia flagellata]
MDLISDKNMRISSANGRVNVSAKEELLLKYEGSYIRISSTGLEDGARGHRTISSATFCRQVPSSLAETVNNWKHAPFDEEFP